MAAGGSPVQDLCEEATCSICLDYFRDPVTTAECGHNFCRSCLSQCWEKSQTEASCPQCRERIQQRTLIPNRQLANFVQITKKLALQGAKGAEWKGRVCEKHQEPLKLFCKEDETPICVVCDRSKEHRQHTVIPLEEASEEWKGLLCSHLEILRKERERNLADKAEVEKESQELLKLTETEKLKAVEAFRRLHQFLEEQEECLMNRTEEMEKKIARKRDEHLARLSRELSSLQTMVQEMEEKCRQPPVELLQDARSTLQSCEKRETFGNPVAFPPELKWKISGLCDINLSLECAMKQFKDALLLKQSIQKGKFPVEDKIPRTDRDAPLLREQFQKANVTLDPDTANPILNLSEDRKSVRQGTHRQDLPDNPERFDTIISVLGREGFATGSHFWDVVVGSEGDWAVGFTRKSVRRKGSFHLSPQGGIWAVGKWGGEYKAFDPPDNPFLFLSGETNRIQLFLNYEGGQVSFFNADTGAHLHTFSRASFSGETLLPFFYLWGNKTHIRIA